MQYQSWLRFHVSIFLEFEGFKSKIGNLIAPFNDQN